jgi:dihydrofolate reductase
VRAEGATPRWRKTYDTVGRPLPERVNIVITRQPDFAAEGIVVVHSLDEALRIAKAAGDDEPFIAGGEQIFEQTLHVADRIYLTRVHAEVEGDTFPEFDDVSEWQLTDAEHFDADEKNEYPFSFPLYERAGAEGHAIPEGVNPEELRSAGRDLPPRGLSSSGFHPRRKICCRESPAACGTCFVPPAVPPFTNARSFSTPAPCNSSRPAD